MPEVTYEENGTHGWSWTLSASNGRIIAWATGYNSKAGARKAFRRTRQLMIEMLAEETMKNIRKAHLTTPAQ